MKKILNFSVILTCILIIILGIMTANLFILHTLSEDDFVQLEKTATVIANTPYSDLNLYDKKITYEITPKSFWVSYTNFTYCGRVKVIQNSDNIELVRDYMLCFRIIVTIFIIMIYTLLYLFYIAIQEIFLEVKTHTFKF